MTVGREPVNISQGRHPGHATFFKLTIGDIDMTMVISTQRATINTLSLISRDCIDESIKLFSNAGATIRLPRNHKDEFWWNRDGLFVIKNCSEQLCHVQLTVVKCTGDLLICRSSAGPARTFEQGDSATLVLKGQQSLTFRSNDAQGKGATNL